MVQNKDKNYLFWLILLGIFCCLVYVLRSILLPFVLGCIIGYLFDPIVDRLEKFKINRTCAVCITLASIILIAVPSFLAILYLAEDQIKTFIAGAPKYINALNNKLSLIISYLQDNIPQLNKEHIVSYMQDNVTNSFKFAGKLLQKLITGSFALFNIISLLLITPIVAFYMLRDWDSFILTVDNLIPKSHKKEIRQQAKAIDKIISSFIRGQLSVCLILGIMYAIGLSIIGLDLGLLVGFIAGIISFIPYVGSITGFFLSICIALTQFNTISPILAVIAVFIIGQAIEGNFLTPKLVGDSVGLHPVWVMFALLAGGVLLGFLGLMLAVPMAAIIGVLIRFAISKYKQSSLYQN